MMSLNELDPSLMKEKRGMEFLIRFSDVQFCNLPAGFHLLPLGSNVFILCMNIAHRTPHVG